MSSTPVDRSAEVKISVASHLSNVPAMDTDDSTSNLIELSCLGNSENRDPSPVWARHIDENIIEVKKQTMVSRIAL